MVQHGIPPRRIRDYVGTHEEYVHACGDNHLDAGTVVLKAKGEGKKARKRELANA